MKSRHQILTSRMSRRNFQGACFDSTCNLAPCFAFSAVVHKLAEEDLELTDFEGLSLLLRLEDISSSESTSSMKASPGEVGVGNEHALRRWIFKRRGNPLSLSSSALVQLETSVAVLSSD